MKTVAVNLELTEDQAWALAQFVKRAHFGTCERLSDPTDKEEPQLMMNALLVIQRALRESGYAPR